MKIKYIKANGNYYFPQEPGVENPDPKIASNLPVCYIKKLLFGRYRIDYYDDMNVLPSKDGFYSHVENRENYPNTRVILYPSGIEEIKYYLHGRNKNIK